MPKQLTAKQALFIKKLRSRLYRYLLFGGGVGGGKSYLGASIIVNLAYTHPGTSYAVLRKNLPTLKRTTLQTFLKYCREHNFKEGRDFLFNKADMTFTFNNGSIIYFMEADITKDPDVNKLGGLELTAAMIDEADEVAEAIFNVLKFRVGRNNPGGILAFIFLTCNPNQTWVRALFYDPARKGELKPPYLFIESLASDNPFNSEDYLQAIADPNTPRQFRARYFEGDWDYIVDLSQIIQLRELERAYHDALLPGTGKSIGFDPNREGNDMPVAVVWEGNQITRIEVADIEIGPDTAITTELARWLMNLAREEGVPADMVAVDAVGVGGGVVDTCRDEGFNVREFKSGSTEGIDTFKAVVDKTGKRLQPMKRYDNIRSQTYWKMAVALTKRVATIYSKVAYRDELQKDLLAHTFTTDGKVIRVEPKDKVKVRLRRSPDFGDAAMMGWWVKTIPKTGGTVKTGQTTYGATRGLSSRSRYTNAELLRRARRRM